MSSEREKFLDRIRVDKATIDRTNEVGKNYDQNKTGKKSSSSFEGGRERGDDGPGKIGRESGYKTGNSKSTVSRAQAVNNASGKSNQSGSRVASVKSASNLGVSNGQSASGRSGVVSGAVAGSGQGASASGGKGASAGGQSGAGNSGGGHGQGK